MLELYSTFFPIPSIQEGCVSEGTATGWGSPHQPGPWITTLRTFGPRGYPDLQNLLYLATEHLRFCMTTECLIYIANVLHNKEKVFPLKSWMPTSLLLLDVLASANTANAIRQEKKITTIFSWDAHRWLLWLPLLCNKWAPNDNSEYVHDFMDQEFREGSSGQFLLSVSPVVAVRWGLGFESFFSPPWARCPWWLTHMALVDAGYLLGDQLGYRLRHLHVTPPPWWSQGSQTHHLAPAFSQTQCPKRLWWKLSGLFWPGLLSCKGSLLWESTGCKGFTEISPDSRREDIDSPSINSVSKNLQTCF